MTNQEFIAAIARSLYWGYLKDTTGTPGKWSDLSQEERKTWRKMAQRAVRKIEELTPARESESPG
jgi:hypothetical protein